MLLGLRSLWEGGGAPPTPGVAGPEAGASSLGAFFSGKPVYTRPKKKKKPAWPGDEIEEDELEELLAMLGIDL